MESSGESSPDPNYHYQDNDQKYFASSVDVTSGRGDSYFPYSEEKTLRSVCCYTFFNFLEQEVLVAHDANVFPPLTGRGEEISTYASSGG